MTVIVLIVSTIFSLSLQTQVDEQLPNDSNDLESKRELESLRELEKSLDCMIMRFPFGYDDVTGLKMLYLKMSDSPYNVKNGVDYVVLINNHNEIVFVVSAVLRHDRDF